MKDGAEALARFRAAYKATTFEPWQGKLPARDDLTSAMREAFIHVYHQGARDTFDALEAARKRASIIGRPNALRQRI